MQVPRTLWKPPVEDCGRSRAVMEVREGTRQGRALQALIRDSDTYAEEEGTIAGF